MKGQTGRGQIGANINMRGNPNEIIKNAEDRSRQSANTQKI